MISIYRKLGELLVAHGQITNLQLSIALAAQETSNRRLGEILVERGFTTEEEIAQCLAHQYGYPVSYLTDIQPEADALAAINLETALNLRVLPLWANAEEFACVIADPLDIPATDQLAAIVRKRLKLTVAPESALNDAIREAYGVKEDTSSGHFGEIDFAPGRFENLRPVQRIGEVALFSAFDATLERKVGLLAILDESDRCASHLRLVRSAAKVATREVCSVYDSFAANGYRWTVIEPLEGETLDRILSTRGKRSLAQAADLVSRVAEGVDSMHQSGSGCGWVCPANILVRSEAPMLAPFTTPPGHYVLLDSLAGGSSSVSGDVYALGMLLWECVFGASREGINLDEGPDKLFTHDFDVPGAMREILLNCFEADPQKRFASPIQLASALRSYNWSSISYSKSKGTGFERDELLATLTTIEHPTVKLTLWEKLFGRRSDDQRAA